jgi:hypothetical protein
MKKLLFMMSVLLISGVVMAQGSKGTMTNKSFLAFHGGPSFTTGFFANTNFNNTLSGFAKTGFNLNLNYGYHFSKMAGITGSVFYSRYNLDKTAIAEIATGANADHWQFYGISAGPMLSHEFSKKVAGDLYVMGGPVTANSPKITYDNSLALPGTWAWTGMVQAGVGMRFNVGGNFFIYANGDYMYMQPEFKLETFSGILTTERHHQTISVFNLTGGIGMNF